MAWPNFFFIRGIHKLQDFKEKSTRDSKKVFWVFTYEAPIWDLSKLWVVPRCVRLSGHSNYGDRTDGKILIPTWTRQPVQDLYTTTSICV